MTITRIRLSQLPDEELERIAGGGGAFDHLARHPLHLLGSLAAPLWPALFPPPARWPRVLALADRRGG